MAKGTVAKQKVTETIREAFGINFIGEYDKKLYVLANDGGEMVQIAISLTCPKVQVEFAASTPVGDYNFEEDAPATKENMLKLAKFIHGFCDAEE